MIKIRRIVGMSMLPNLRPDQIVIFSNKNSIKPGDVAIVHLEGREIVKRISRIKPGKAWLLGDNPFYSTDSRSFGWIDQSSIKGRLWLAIPPIAVLLKQKT